MNKGFTGFKPQIDLHALASLLSDNEIETGNDLNFVSACGADHGWVRAWLIGDVWLVWHTDNATSHCELVEKALISEESDLACYVLPDRPDFSGTDVEYHCASIETLGADHFPSEPDSKEGPFSVVEVHSFYHGTLPKELSVEPVLQDDGMTPVEFDTIEDAREWISQVENETYRARNGETGSPTYKIVKAGE